LRQTIRRHGRAFQIVRGDLFPNGLQHLHANRGWILFLFVLVLLLVLFVLVVGTAMELGEDACLEGHQSSVSDFWIGVSQSMDGRLWIHSSSGSIRSIVHTRINIPLLAVLLATLTASLSHCLSGICL
jgi:hypothetical protein